MVEALRAHDPGAPAALYDTYAENVYQYCWAMLGSPDSAQVALRDTLIAAETHVASLADADRLRVWLFALARGECLRRWVPGGADQADTGLSAGVESTGAEVSTETELFAVVGSSLPDSADADLRVVAWNARRALAAEDREVLELAIRHGLAGVDLAAVLGTGRHFAEALLEAATERLRDAVTVEILARKGTHDCSVRAEILTGVIGDVTPQVRDQVIRHLPDCAACRPHRVRQVSVAKVFGLLPEVVLPLTLRVRVMSCLTDPELAAYRRYVAKRVGALDLDGFPSAQALSGHQWAQAIAGALAAVAAVAIVVLAFDQLADGPENRIVGIASGAFPPTGEPPGIQVPWTAAPEDMPMVLRPIVDISPSYPAGSRHPVEPIIGVTPDPHPIPSPSPSPTKPTDGGGQEPTIAPPTPPGSTETPPVAQPTGEPGAGPTAVPGRPHDHHHHHPRRPHGHHHHPGFPCDQRHHSRPRTDCSPTPTPTVTWTPTLTPAPPETPVHASAQAPMDSPSSPSPPAAPSAAEPHAPTPAPTPTPELVPQASPSVAGSA